MGACGCGEGYDFRLKAPRGWYLINVYPGCDYCDTPAGVHIDFETRADFSSALPDYPIDKDGLGAGLAIVSADSVKSALLAELTGAVVDGEAVDDLCEFDDLHKRVFAHAVRGALEAARAQASGEGGAR